MRVVWKHVPSIKFRAPNGQWFAHGGWPTNPYITKRLEEAYQEMKKERP